MLICRIHFREVRACKHEATDFSLAHARRENERRLAIPRRGIDAREILPVQEIPDDVHVHKALSVSLWLRYVWGWGGSSAVTFSPANEQSLFQKQKMLCPALAPLCSIGMYGLKRLSLNCVLQSQYMNLFQEKVLAIAGGYLAEERFLHKTDFRDRMLGSG